MSDEMRRNRNYALLGVGFFISFFSLMFGSNPLVIASLLLLGVVLSLTGFVFIRNDVGTE